MAFSLHAQEYRGRIQGVVTDSSQASIVGADVSLFNVKTGVRTVRQTNETGAYLFDYVDPGAYQLSVEFQGFKKFQQENITVESRGDVTVNAVLSPGSTQESVTVTDSPVAVQFNSSNVQITIDTKLANEVPRFDR
ncbi:MAG TPA: carboxypeptidase-like regulatory domain-containing protein, partial [Pyrinomonadaceae bacterium]